MRIESNQQLVKDITEITFQTAFMRAVDSSVHEAILAYAVAALSAESVVWTIDVHVTNVSCSPCNNNRKFK